MCLARLYSNAWSVGRLLRPLIDGKWSCGFDGNGLVCVDDLWKALVKLAQNGIM